MPVNLFAHSLEESWVDSFLLAYTERANLKMSEMPPTLEYRMVYRRQGFKTSFAREKGTSVENLQAQHWR
jgi:hypothetical protein